MPWPLSPCHHRWWHHLIFKASSKDDRVLWRGSILGESKIFHHCRGMSTLETTLIIGDIFPKIPTDPPGTYPRNPQVIQMWVRICKSQTGGWGFFGYVPGMFFYVLPFGRFCWWKGINSTHWKEDPGLRQIAIYLLLCDYTLLLYSPMIPVYYLLRYYILQLYITIW